MAFHRTVTTYLYLFLSLYALRILSVTGLQLVTKFFVTGGWKKTSLRLQVIENYRVCYKDVLVLQLEMPAYALLSWNENH